MTYFRKKYVELEVSVIGLHTNVICSVWHKDTHVNLIVKCFFLPCVISIVFSLLILNDMKFSSKCF